MTTTPLKDGEAATRSFVSWLPLRYLFVDSCASVRSLSLAPIYSFMGTCFAHRVRLTVIRVLARTRPVCAMVRMVRETRADMGGVRGGGGTAAG